MRSNRYVKFRNRKTLSCPYSIKFHSQDKFKVKSVALKKNFKPYVEVLYTSYMKYTSDIFS
jgi:hypothetical protein